MSHASKWRKNVKQQFILLIFFWYSVRVYLQLNKTYRLIRNIYIIYEQIIDFTFLYVINYLYLTNKVFLFNNVWRKFF